MDRPKGDRLMQRGFENRMLTVDVATCSHLVVGADGRRATCAELAVAARAMAEASRRRGHW